MRFSPKPRPSTTTTWRLWRPDRSRRWKPTPAICRSASFRGGVETHEVVGIEITGVPAMDASVANHLVQTVEASRLLGATVIVTGLSAEIAQTLVNIGVDLGKMNTVGDLQGGIEEAERLLGYKVLPIPESSPNNHA